MNIHQDKIFVIGLPRTATTSLCVAMLELGFKTAHTAYTYQSFQQAEVIADTPVFYDYPSLDKIFPGSLFIYLERDLQHWLPSIKQLLNRMSANLLRPSGGFNPALKTCFKKTFEPFNVENIQSDQFLTECYLKHKSSVQQYFSDREKTLLTLNISQADSYDRLLEFLISHNKLSSHINRQTGFKRINTAGKVTAWNQVKHPLKIESTRAGKIDSINYALLR